MTLRRDNHFVPKSYLKWWADSHGKVWCYRLLVPHENVRPWKQHSLSGIAYQQHLYTTVQDGEITDEFEKWLDREIEGPAEPVIEKVVQGHRLDRDDWMRLIRFTAAQDARTPARYLEDVARWNRHIEGWMQDTLQNTITKLEEHGIPRDRPASRRAPEDFPFKVTIEKDEERGGGWAKVETVVGRKMWVSSIRQRATTTWRHLRQHKWSIMAAPSGMTWLTSDDPVIRLNYRGPGQYDFGGGYGSKGSEFIFPLSPQYMLYTQIGKRLPNALDVDLATARRIQEMIVIHAHRWVFASEPNQLVHELRPRDVNSEMFIAESHEWQKWHAEQTAAEKDLGV